MSRPDNSQSIPLPTIRRYPEYLLVLQSWQEKKAEWISATDIGCELGHKPIVVRKDLAYSGAEGLSRRGYRVTDLICLLRRALGWDNQADAFLLGLGSLGQALLSYQGFAGYGLKIVAAFDPDRDARARSGKPGITFAPEKLPDLAYRMKVVLGIIAVPGEHAQAAADLLVESGIRGIWNFAPVNLKVPEDIIVKQEDLSMGLAILSYQLGGQQAGKQSLPAAVRPAIAGQARN